MPLSKDISNRRFLSAVQSLVRQGKLVQRDRDQWTLTAGGIQQAARAVRQHRLLELYFSRVADLSPAAIDRGADYCEHALDESMLMELERDIQGTGQATFIPTSLHPLRHLKQIEVVDERRFLFLELGLVVGWLDYCDGHPLFGVRSDPR